MKLAFAWGMQRVPETSWMASRKYLAHLQGNLKQDGDPRLARALSDYGTLIFTLEWTLLVLSTILLVCFIRLRFFRRGLELFRGFSGRDGSRAHRSESDPASEPVFRKTGLRGVASGPALVPSISFMRFSPRSEVGIERFGPRRFTTGRGLARAWRSP